MQNSTERTFIRNYVSGVETLLEGYQKLISLKKQYDALDLGNTIQEDDFLEFVGMTIGELKAAITSISAIETLFGQGHATNLYRMKR
jgi:hypothetical protein